jgi:hypothetical protein
MSYTKKTAALYREAAQTKRAACLPTQIRVSVPPAVAAERDRALAAERTPNQEILGDPLPGRPRPSICEWREAVKTPKIGGRTRATQSQTRPP